MVKPFPETAAAARVRTGTRANGATLKQWMRPAHTMFAVAWGGNEFTPLLVMYRNNHHLPATVVNLLLFAYVLGIVPALLIGGPLSDRYGRRALLYPAPLIAMLGSLTLAFSHSSIALLVIGRILSGIALGLAMAAGSSWVKELSSPPHDAADAGAGARRGAMSLTSGFGIGALVAGLLAQWAPYPDQLAFFVNVLITLPALFLLRDATETVARGACAQNRLIDDLKIPVFAHRRFLFVVLPVAPWVFGSAACAYAVLPAVMSSRVASAPIAFSALLCLVGLGCGFFVQSLGRKFDRPGTARAVKIALVVLIVGMAFAALVVTELSVPLAIAGAFLLGAGYGLAMVSGLLEIQRMADPRDLAGLTAVFYSVTYLGFAVPAVMSFLAKKYDLSYPPMFLFGSVVAALCLAIVVTHDRRSRLGANRRLKQQPGQ